MGAQLRLTPTPLPEAYALVERMSHCSRPHRGCEFCIGAMQGSALVGVLIAGRPFAWHRDDGLTLEVRQVCVIAGAPRVTRSLLYDACWRAARGRGYVRAIVCARRLEAGHGVAAPDGRDFLGVELSAAYTRMAGTRLRQAGPARKRSRR